LKVHPASIESRETRAVSPLQIFEEVEFLPYQSESLPPPDSPLWFCVRYLREVLGVNIKGDAKDIIPNSPPTKGSVALFRFKNSYHASLIVELFPGGFLVKEANFIPGTAGERFVYYDDPTIRGFYFPQQLASR